jgi:GT2 family glycosyltransferase
MAEQQTAVESSRALYPKVAVIVLNWNGHDVLGDCLRSLNSLSYPAVETIVVDNASSDDSVKIVKNEFANCLLIENVVNVGFSAGNNQGIRMAFERGNDYIMLLNNDTILDRDCVTWLVERAESDPKIGAVSPKIYFADPRDRLWFAGGKFSYWKGRNGLIGYAQQDEDRYTQPGEMEFISGCALLASREVWQEVGELDELYFWAGEDVDWSLRLRKAGYKLFYEPRSQVWHRVSYSMLQSNGEAGRLYYYTRNNILYMWRHARWWHWITFAPYFGTLSLARVFRAVRGRDWAALRSIYRGFRDCPPLLRRVRRSQLSPAPSKSVPATRTLGDHLKPIVSAKQR